MTILIAARSGDGIIATADGRSNLTDKTGHSVASDSLQKIFPHKSFAIAIAHHGENKFAGKPVSEFVGDFLTSLTTDNLDVAALGLLSTLDGLIASTLAGNSWTKYCGFWVMGRTATGSFAVYEVDWGKTEHGVQRKVTPHGPLLMGGDCARYVKQYLNAPIDAALSHSKLLSNGLDYAKRLSDELYQMVMKALPSTCGGHKHQLQINRTGTAWVEPPA